MEYFYLFFAVQFFYIFRLLVGKNLLLGGKSTTLVRVLNAASVIRHRYTVCCYDDTRVSSRKLTEWVYTGPHRVGPNRSSSVRSVSAPKLLNVL